MEEGVLMLLRFIVANSSMISLSFLGTVSAGFSPVYQAFITGGENG
jgi:hypothetical protein